MQQFTPDLFRKVQHQLNLGGLIPSTVICSPKRFTEFQKGVYRETKVIQTIERFDDETFFFRYDDVSIEPDRYCKDNLIYFTKDCRVLACFDFEEYRG